jgi:Tfp pilus assembly protein PilF
VLAAIALADGDPETAITLRRRALAIHSEQYGDRHPQVATAWHGLGQALAAQERTAAADSALTRAVEIRRSVYGPDHRLTRSSVTAREELRAR